MVVYTVRVVGNNLRINDQDVGQPFKTGPDGNTGINFNEHFWKKCFTGDSNKDGCPITVLNGFLQNDNPALPNYFVPDDRVSGDTIKGISSQMTSRLEENNLIFKAEILRFKNYKTGLGMDPHLQTQFSTAFPEGNPIYTNKDCGLDPQYFLPQGLCIKSCNIASDVIDPHSSSIADCGVMLPQVDSQLVLDESVFTYLQYPCACRLVARTDGVGTYTASFFVNGVDLLEPQNQAKYFSGNATKNALFSTKGTPAAKTENMKLCVAKYSGDTLQSFIQRLFEIININNNNNRTYVISTCDSIVSLRSYTLNGSFIEVCKDPIQDKVTQVFVWRPELADIGSLAVIFNAEKNKILAEYNNFISLVNGIENPQTQLRNVFVSGSNTTYKFTQDFYERIALDLTMIRDGIQGYDLVAGADVAAIALAIRTIRTFKVNDFLKINGPNGQLYCMSMATKYTKGNLTQLGLLARMPNINKRVSQPFFEVATQQYMVRQGGAGSQEQNQLPCDMEDIIEVFNTFFDMNFYNDNPKIFLSRYIAPSNIFEKNENENEIELFAAKRVQIKPNTPIDLHLQFITDFMKLFNKLCNQQQYTRFKTPLFIFDCFSDVINSFASLDIYQNGVPRNGNEYYSKEAIAYLIETYFEEKIEEQQAEQQARSRARAAVEYPDKHRIKPNKVIKNIKNFQKTHDSKIIKGKTQRRERRGATRSQIKSGYKPEYKSGYRQRVHTGRGGSKTRKIRQ
jgi:hypothetical protein